MGFILTNRNLPCVYTRFINTHSEQIQKNSSYPQAKMEPMIGELHGVIMQDDYRWMQDWDSPAMQKHLQAEHAYAQSMFETPSMNTHRASLLRDMKQLSSISSTATQDLVGGWLYYMSSGSTFVRRREGEPEEEEEMILDLSEVLEPGTSASIGGIQISRDHRFVAFSLDTTGEEVYSVYVVDLSPPLPSLHCTSNESTPSSSLSSLASAFFSKNTTNPTSAPSSQHLSNHPRRPTKPVLVAENVVSTLWAGGGLCDVSMVAPPRDDETPRDDNDDDDDDHERGTAAEGGAGASELHDDPNNPNNPDSGPESHDNTTAPATLV